MHKTEDAECIYNCSNTDICLMALLAFDKLLQDAAELKILNAIQTHDAQAVVATACLTCGL